MLHRKPPSALAALAIRLSIPANMRVVMHNCLIVHQYVHGY
jgi:hypothetical protein